MARRKLTETANHFGGVLATARWQGRIKQLEKPSSSKSSVPCLTALELMLDWSYSGAG